MLVKFEQIIWSEYTKFWAFDEIWQTVDAILEDVSVTETIV